MTAAERITEAARVGFARPVKGAPARLAAAKGRAEDLVLALLRLEPSQRIEVLRVVFRRICMACGSDGGAACVCEEPS